MCVRVFAFVTERDRAGESGREIERAGDKVSVSLHVSVHGRERVNMKGEGREGGRKRGVRMDMQERMVATERGRLGEEIVMFRFGFLDQNAAS